MELDAQTAPKITAIAQRVWIIAENTQDLLR